MTDNKSPLRYPGGKTRACNILNKIIEQYFDINKFDYILSPFFGGGSFEFFMQNKYNLKIIANDKFQPLYNFWNTCKENKTSLCYELNKKLNTITKELFMEYRNKIIKHDNNLEQAIMYFIINRCSFSGATLSGGFSKEASNKRFTKSSIDKINSLNLDNFSIENMDFTEFLLKHKSKKNLIFLDPPYYLNNSTLYGKNGNMHSNFNHIELHKIISKKNNWILTYNNCDYIKKLYKKYTIIETNWSYGMNKSKKSSEIVIINIL